MRVQQGLKRPVIEAGEYQQDQRENRDPVKNRQPCITGDKRGTLAVAMKLAIQDCNKKRAEIDPAPFRKFCEKVEECCAHAQLQNVSGLNRDACGGAQQRTDQAGVKG